MISLDSEEGRELINKAEALRTRIIASIMSKIDGKE